MMSEETRLVELMQNGDKEAREKLFFNNRWLVKTIANKFAKKTVDIDQEELESAGDLALLETLDNFDLKFKTRISTYAYARIFNAIWSTVISYRCGVTIPNYLYKRVCVHVKAPKVTDANFAKQNRLSLDELEGLISVTRIGIPTFSNLCNSLGTGNDYQSTENLSAEDFLLKDTKDEITPSNGDVWEVPFHVRMELGKIGEKLDKYTTQVLTKRQHRVLSLTVIPFLKGEQYLNIVETAKFLKHKTQAINQIIGYMRMRLRKSQQGRESLLIIEETIKFLKQKRSYGNDTAGA